MEESKKKLGQKLKKPYRLVILKEDSLEEVGSYRLTPLGFYTLFSSIFVGLSLLVAVMIIFTPMKRWIPGYGDGASHAEITRLQARIIQMEKQFEMQKRYTDNIRRILTGEVYEDSGTAEPATFTEEMLRVDRVSEDNLLRQQVILQEMENRRQSLPGAPASTDIPLEQILFTTPLKGEISAGFDAAKKHFGVDIIAPRNTPIKAAREGYVFFADWTLETGNTIGLVHDHHVVTFYKHNSMLLKKTGDYVQAGEAIAIIGNTGTMTSGPHLHFELWHKGRAVDATRYIGF
jgi:murein DD-endopeptidase MepM/ murein hydrolase activator NlpD